MLVPSVVRAEDEEEDDDLASVVVTATRSGNIVGKEPLRVEVVPQEEIEENQTVQPGNLTTLLVELGGARMQSTSTGLGGTALQMRGMPGRHTLVLQDGLPLLGTQTDGFGLLQTPPLDLARVEVIKGVGSALYGASALGGVLNLASRTPDSEPEILLNRSSRGGTDAIGFASHEFQPGRGLTLTVSINDQSHEDVDDDAWADLASYRRYYLRPRFFWNEGDHSVFATLGYVDEDRAGGSMPGKVLADGSTFEDAVSTRRIDGGLTTSASLSNGLKMATRWSGSVVDHNRTFGVDHVKDSLETAYGEGTVAGQVGSHAWLFGTAFQYERLTSDDAPDAGYRYVVPAVFAQDQYSPGDKVTLAASARLDHHNEFGTFFSPRFSVLWKPAEDWSLRGSVGSGFAAPTPLLDEIESTSLARLLQSGDIEPERAESASLDLTWADEGWEISGSVFGSRIRHTLTVERSVSQPDRYVPGNATSPSRVGGAELLVHFVDGPLHMIASSTYLDATEEDPSGGRQRAYRTPRWSAELATMLEDEDRGRVGLEISYTGDQRLDDNPYRDSSREYVEVDALAEIKFGSLSIYFNAMDLADVRQSDFDPLLRVIPAPTGERVVNVWAPLVGRTFNFGFRMKL
ncbi:MAG: TonB-dependent receptor [Peristeroidobacter soli]